MKRLILAVLLCFLIVAPATALEIEDLSTDSGPQVWLSPQTAVPVVSLNLVFRKAGGAYVPENLQGLTRVLSAALDQGAGNYDRKAFQDELYRHAISLSFRDTPDTFEVSARTLTENLPKTIELITLALTQPHFKDDDLSRIKSQLLAGRRLNLQNPAYVAAEYWQKLYFGNHPYGRPLDPEAGTLEKMNAAHLRAFLKERLARDQLLVAVVGDVDGPQVQNKLAPLFAALPPVAKPATLPPVSPPAEAVTAAPHFKTLDVPQSIIIAGQATVPRQHPQFFEVSLLNVILGASGQSSRLYEELRQQRGLVYSASTTLDVYADFALFKGMAASRAETAREALNQMQGVWSDVAATGVSAAELKAAKDYLKGSFALNLSDTRKIAAVLSVLQYYELGRDYLDQRETKIDAVTLETINTFIKTYINPAALVTVKAGRPEVEEK